MNPMGRVYYREHGNVTVGTWERINGNLPLGTHHWELGNMETTWYDIGNMDTKSSMYKIQGDKFKMNPR